MEQGTFRQKDNLEGKYYPLSILPFSIHCGSKIHPTQKPVGLYEYLIRTYTQEGELILDFAAGSGTLGIAAKNTNRNYIMIEKDKKYFEIMVERVNNHIPT